MKKLLIVFILAGCGHSGESGAPAFLPGIYVRESTNEFSHIADTFMVRRTVAGANEYQVQRRSSFQRIHGAVKMPVELQSEEWLGVYDPSKWMLAGMDKNQELSYAPKENRLYHGADAYEKVE